MVFYLCFAYRKEKTMPRTISKTQNKSPYSVHPGIAMMQEWIAALPQKTGRTLEEWIQLVKESGPNDERGRREWLKTQYNLGTNSAWWIAERAEGKGMEESDPDMYLREAVKWVDAMYARSKAGLRPIHEQLLVLGAKLGKDVRICPGKTIVPF